MSHPSSRSSTQQHQASPPSDGGISEMSMADQIADLVKKQAAEAEQQQQLKSADDDLPEPWVAKRDSRTGKIFYYNRQTKATTWKRPTGTATSRGSKEDENNKDGSSRADTPSANAAAASSGDNQNQNQQQQNQELISGAVFISNSALKQEDGEDVSQLNGTSFLASASIKGGGLLALSTDNGSLFAAFDLSRYRVEKSGQTSVVLIREKRDDEEQQQEQPQQPQKEAAPEQPQQSNAEQDGEKQEAVEGGTAEQPEKQPEQEEVKPQQQQPAPAVAATPATPKKTTILRLILQPTLGANTISAWVDALRSVSMQHATATAATSSDDALDHDSVDQLFALASKAVATDLAVAATNEQDDENASHVAAAAAAATARTRYAFLAQSWCDAGEAFFEAEVRSRVDFLARSSAAVVAKLVSSANAAITAANNNTQAARNELEQLNGKLQEALQVQDSLHSQLSQTQRGGGSPTGSTRPSTSETQQQQQQNQQQHRNSSQSNNYYSSQQQSPSQSRSGSNSTTTGNAINDLVNRLANQYSTELSTFSEQAREMQRQFHSEAQRLTTLIAQKVHQDEILMHSAPQLGASAEEHIRHRRSLEEAFKSLQTMHGDTCTQLENARKKIFDLRIELTQTTNQARQAVEQERDRSQSALRAVQQEASDHMKHLAANVDTLRTQHAEEMDRVRGNHEEQMAILTKKLQIAEAKMLRSVEETERSKFQLQQKTLEDRGAIAELERKCAALELTIRELRKAASDKESQLESHADAVARAVDRKAAAEVARFKRLMIDRTLAGSPASSSNNNSNSNGSGVLLVNSPLPAYATSSRTGNGTPRSPHNIGVGDTSAGHELFNSYRTGGSLPAGAHTQRAMREATEAVSMLSPRSGNNSAVDEQLYSNSHSSSSRAPPAGVPRINMAAAVRTPRQAGVGAGGVSARSSTYAATTSARGGGGAGSGVLFESPNATSDPVAESETYRKLADISARLKDGLVSLGAGSAAEMRRRVF